MGKRWIDDRLFVLLNTPSEAWGIIFPDYDKHTLRENRRLHRIRGSKPSKPAWWHDDNTVEDIRNYLGNGKVEADRPMENMRPEDMLAKLLEMFGSYEPTRHPVPVINKQPAFVPTPQPEERKLKAMVFDLETGQCEGSFWPGRYGKYEVNINNIYQQTYIISIAWKFLGESEVHFLGLPDFPGYEPGSKDDRQLVTAIHKLFSQADYLVAHNGDKFDIPVTRTRFVEHGLYDTTPSKNVDTKKIAKSRGQWLSNSLKDLCNSLGLASKGDPGGLATWDACIAGEKWAWDKMKEYNIQDIVTLEQLYLALRPYASTHPNVAQIIGNKGGCRICGKDDQLTYIRDDFTNSNTYPVYLCGNCKAMNRKRTPFKEVTKVSFTK